MNRRETVAALGLAVASVLLGTGGPGGLEARTHRILAFPAPDVDPEDPSFEVFYRLSQLVAGRDELDMAAARKLYPVFMQEPWGPKHIATAFTEIYDVLTNAEGPLSVAAIVRDGQIGEGETWFVSHLLTTWYLGIYYHEARVERLLYEDALMWERVGAWKVIPGIPSETSRQWMDPPAGHKRDG